MAIKFRVEGCKQNNKSPAKKPAPFRPPPNSSNRDSSMGGRNFLSLYLSLSLLKNTKSKRKQKNKTKSDVCFLALEIDLQPISTTNRPMAGSTAHRPWSQPTNHRPRAWAPFPLLRVLAPDKPHPPRPDRFQKFTCQSMAKTLEFQLRGLFLFKYDHIRQTFHVTFVSLFRIPQFPKTSR